MTRARNAGNAKSVALSLIAAFAALLAIGWLLLRDDSTTSPIAARSASGGGGSGADDKRDNERVPDAMADDGAIAATRTDDPLAAELAPAQDAVAGLGPTLIVLDRESRRPLPEASLLLVLQDEVSAEEWDGLVFHDPQYEPLIAARGKPIALDALASATLPWRAGDGLAVADCGDRHGRLDVRLDAGDRQFLRLVRRESLTLRAVDPDRYPQRDVPLSLQSLRRGDPWRGAPKLLWSQRSDQDGEVTFAQGSELLDEHLDDDALATARALVAALAFPCRDPAPVLVDPRTGCSLPTLVVTPPRATLRLRAEGSDPGKPFGGVVEVRAAFAGKSAIAIPVQRTWPVTIGAGGAVELTVEADIDVRLDAQSPDDRFEAESITVHAPARAESLDVVLALREKPAPASCTLRVVAPSGAPLASSEVAWQLHAYAPSGEGAFDLGKVAPDPGRLERATTDGEGRVQIATSPLASYVAKLAENAGNKERRRGPLRTLAFLELFADLDQPRPVGARLVGALALAALQSDEAADLGTVTLVEVPALCGGRVVDPEGHGVEAVNVRVTDTRDPPTTWSATTDRAGRWLVHANATTPSLDVWPTRERWYRGDEFGDDNKPVPLRIPAGKSDLEVTLHRDGFAHGRLLVDAGISLFGLVVDTLPRPSPGVHCDVQADGRFEVYGPPGRRTLVVWSRFGLPLSKKEPPPPIAEVDDFVLDEAKETIDPRLDPIDLLRDLRQVELAVSATDGSPIANAVVRLVLAGKQLVPVERSTDPFGRAIVTTPAFDSWLIVGTPAHRFRKVLFEPSFQEITLAPATIVRIRVEGPAEPLLTSKYFLPSLARDDDGLFAAVWNELPRKQARRVDTATFELSATMSGSYALWWKRRPEDRDRDALRGPTLFNVHDGDTVVELVEKLSDRDVANILPRLRR